MPPYPNTDKNKFITAILQALHLKTDAFVYNLTKQSPYEMIIYVWIDKLYEKGKTTEEAVQLIYKARNIFLLNNPGALCNNT